MSSAPAAGQQPPAGSCYKRSAGDWHGSFQLRSTGAFPTATITGERVLCPEEQLARQADEDQVVIALIDSIYRRQTKISLMDSTRSAFAREEWQIHADGIDPSLARDYRIANNESRMLRGLLPGRVKFDVVHAVTVLPWLNVSRVGFNADRTVAIVDAFLGCGPRCGYGGLFILKKTNGAWHIIENPIISVS